MWKSGSMLSIVRLAATDRSIRSPHCSAASTTTVAESISYSLFKELITSPTTSVRPLDGICDLG
jgi:hypothetical protein